VSAPHAAADPVEAAAREAIIPMQAAVGYSGIECAHQTTLDEYLVLKHERLFLLVTPHGEVAPAGQCGLGLFYDDTRILSHYALHLGVGRPSLLSSQAPQTFRAQVDLAIDDRSLGGDTWDPKNVLHLRRELLLDDRLTERLTLTSYLTDPLDFSLELALGCDFADIFEVRGWTRAGRGDYFAPQVGEKGIRYAYRGTDGRVMSTHVCFREAPAQLHAHGAAWRLRLQPQEPVELEWSVVPGDVAAHGAETAAPLAVRSARIQHLYDAWAAECTRWTTDAEDFDTALGQAVTDLRALYIETDHEPVISAGIPWYSTIFGRDSLITSLQTLLVNPSIAKGTLRYLARHQGRAENAFTEEQPGKILHELRRGELARAGEIPHVPYYGTIDATPLWLILLHETWRWTGDAELVRGLLPNAERALEWIDKYGDLDGDGFVEYARTSEKGLVNQGWKDSGDGVPFPDGVLPEPPIALAEVQGYVYDAKRRMAMLFAAFGDAARAERLNREASALREQIQERFWMEREGTFALALDGRKRPIPTVATNAGHLLWNRVATPEQARRMAERFLAPDMFSGWGIRTLSAAHPVYNPMSYHNGSVWPHDNAIVALGTALYGQLAPAHAVLTGMRDAAVKMRYYRLPELFCGMTRSTTTAHPVLYPVSCSPQAWASGAFFMLLQATMGILPDARAQVLHIREPQLPPFLRELVVRRLRIGDSRVTLQFTRLGERTLANLLEVEGAPIHVHIELS
jgi:glycogen debranching enzyme